MTAQPVASPPPSGPVVGPGGRSVAAIRVDAELASFVVVNGRPEAVDAWHRVARDVPSLLAEVEAAHRFEQQAGVEREALLAEVAELRELTDAARLLGPARRVLDEAAEGEATREECAAMAQRIVDLIGHPVTDEPPHALVERDSLRRVVQALAEERDEAAAVLAWLLRLKDGPRDDRYRDEKPQAWEAARTWLRGRVVPLAAAADAPQPADPPTCETHR